MPPLVLGSIPLIQAKNYTASARKGVDWIVLHSMESQEKPGTARRVAEWFASENAPQASAHFCVDDNEIIRCVRCEDNLSKSSSMSTCRTPSSVSKKSNI